MTKKVELISPNLGLATQTRWFHKGKPFHWPFEKLYTEQGQDAEAWGCSVVRVGVCWQGGKCPRQRRPHQGCHPMKFYSLEKPNEIRNQEWVRRDSYQGCCHHVLIFFKCYSSPNLCSSNTDQKFTFDAIKLYQVNTETNCTHMGGAQWGLKF